MSKKLIYLICFVVVLSLAGDAQAGWYWWNGSADQDWYNPANWDGGQPLAGDGAQFGAYDTPGPLIQSYDVTIGGIKHGSGDRVTTITVEDATVTTGGWNLGMEYSPANSHGILNVNSGGVINSNEMLVGNHSQGTVNMNGGTIALNNRFIIGVVGPDNGSNGVGHVQLDAGTITANELIMAFLPSSIGTMDVELGTLLLNGDRTAAVQGYIDNGWITGYGGAGSLVLDYNMRNPEKTTLTAVPEPATMMLLGLGGLGLLRRKR